jgi:ABC-type transporter Mla subunit MlaD
MADTSGMGGASSGSMNSGGGAGGLDSVIASVDQSLTSLDPKAGAAAIGQVRQALQGTNAPGLSGIAGNLEQLQQHLQGGSVDGAQVGRLLTTLGQQTRTAAGSAGPIAGVLQQLAGRLDAAGAKLSGGGTSGGGSSGAST